MLILPAIDLRGGQCVRLAQGDYARERVYDSDPVAVAQQFADQGAEWIHVVDLDGARGGTFQNLEAIEAIARTVPVPIEVGGGVRSMEAANRLLDLGVTRVVVGTKLVEDQVLAKEMFAGLQEQVVAGIDSRNGMAAVAGWVSQSQMTALDLAKAMEGLGAKRIILTDIAQDGMLSGPNVNLLESVFSEVNIPIVHSGGIGCLEDLKLLFDMGKHRPEGVIIGRAIYEGRFTVEEAIKFVGTLGP